MRRIVSLLVVVLLASHLWAQDRIREQVDVAWWVIPLFAVDSRDHPVGDLESKDIEVFMDGRRVKDFVLYRRIFDVTKKAAAAAGQEQAAVEKPAPHKGKMIFLLFDTTLTSAESIRRAKVIAKNIVENSARDNRFVIFTVEPLSGLNYKVGPLENKKSVVAAIEGVKERLNKRVMSQKDYVLDMVVGAKGRFAFSESKYSEQDNLFFAKTAAKQLKRKSIPFFSSFTDFYYNVNSIKDNKFIYLFTGGISKFQETMEDGDFYRWYLKQVADWLGRCGSVLFVINAAGPAQTMSSSAVSGRSSLEYLAGESGGKYMQGTKESISERIDNFHRAYFEIAFADAEEFTGNIHKIKVKSKRKGVNIHTLGTVEKSKTYAEMNDIEREILVLNLLSQNPLYHTNIDAAGLKVLKAAEGKEKTSYKVKLPDGYLNRQIDLYRVVTDKKTSQTTIEKERLAVRKSKMKIEFTVNGDVETGIVMVDGDSGTALIAGPGVYDEGDILETAQKGKALSDTGHYRQELAKHLEGAAGYCEKIAAAAFHFFCKEKIAETYTFLTSYGQEVSDISYYENRATTEDMLSRINKVSRSHQRVNKYVFDYQLLHNKGQIKEQRKPLGKKSQTISQEKISALLFSFLTERAVFGPATLLAKEKQEKFTFRLLRYENDRKRRFAVIEAVPKSEQGASFAYGRLWVDIEDNSVKRIEIDPRSIRGYKQLIQRAKMLRARLDLRCTIEYGKLREGIRFPTRVTISETYKGGPFIIKQKGSKGWERSRLEVTYSDYRFFDVDVSVESEAIR